MTEKEKAQEYIEIWKNPEDELVDEERCKQHKKDCEDGVEKLKGITEGRTSTDDENLDKAINDYKEAIKLYENEGF